jgi:uncharacterized BrkB/YihY/UPF0761 family membrane protein
MPNLGFRIRGKQMRDFISMISVLLFIAFIVALFIVIVGIPAILIDKYSCSQFSQQVNNLTIYRIPTGCYVQIGEQWIPKDSYWQYVRIGEK